MFDASVGPKGKLNVLPRFYSLDALRGIAALSVVFWHWRHFFYTGTTPGTVSTQLLPLYNCLFLVYDKGGMAVNLFFSISGFVFYWLYSHRISNDTISFANFTWLRFSRLYPLHFATLILVMAGQWWMTQSQGGPFVYQFNDIKHFTLNLFFASSWGMENGDSFNGPIWSVSVEAALYLVFFFVCRILPIRGYIIIAFALIGLAIQCNIYSPIGGGLVSFFVGGSSFIAYQWISSSRYFHRATYIIATLGCIAWLLTIVTITQGFDFGWVSFKLTPLLWRAEPLLHWIVMNLPYLWTVMILFPLTILALSLTENWRGSLGKRISFFGDISYSSYLLHFPLQLATVALITRLGVNRSLYYSPWFMLFFFFILILTSLASHHYFEKPIQNKLRYMVRSA